MKKAICVGIVFALVMISVMPLVIGDENVEEEQTDVEIDEETQNETRVIEYPYGAEIRLLQLQKNILKSIIKGEMIISVLKRIDVNTTELETIVAELKILLDEVRSADPSSPNATQEFVDLKYDAIELVKEFRDTLKELVNDEIMNQLREMIREATCEEAQNLTIRIRNRIRLYNRNQLHRLYQIIGETNTSLLDEYMNGNITREELINQISKIINQFTKEKRSQIFTELKESNLKAEIHSRIRIEEAKKGFHERRQTRLNNRFHAVQGSEEIDPFIQNQIQNRIRNRLENENKGKGGRQ